MGPKSKNKDQVDSTIIDFGAPPPPQCTTPANFIRAAFKPRPGVRMFGADFSEMPLTRTPVESIPCEKCKGAKEYQDGFMPWGSTRFVRCACTWRIYSSNNHGFEGHRIALAMEAFRGVAGSSAIGGDEVAEARVGGMTACLMYAIMEDAIMELPMDQGEHFRISKRILDAAFKPGHAIHGYIRVV